MTPKVAETFFTIYSHNQKTGIGRRHYSISEVHLMFKANSFT